MFTLHLTFADRPGEAPFSSGFVVIPPGNDRPEDLSPDRAKATTFPTFEAAAAFVAGPVSEEPTFRSARIEAVRPVTMTVSYRVRIDLPDSVPHYLADDHETVDGFGYLQDKGLKPGVFDRVLGLKMLGQIAERIERDPDAPPTYLTLEPVGRTYV